MAKNSYYWLCPKYVHGKRNFKREESCYTRKGDIRKNKQGYVLEFLNPGNKFYAMANKSGYVMQHRLVMAKHLDRVLGETEIVHHINGDKTDNRIENLNLLDKNTHKTTYQDGFRDGYRRGYEAAMLDKDNSDTIIKIGS